MKPFHKSIILSMMISFLFVSSLFYYTNNRLSATLESLHDQEKRLRSTMDTMEITQKEALAQSEDRFSKEVTALRDDIRTLEKMSKASQESIESIGGQLQSVEEESKKKLGELEKQILNVNVKSESFTGIIEKIIKSVVSINTDGGIGSGSIINKEGYIITNRHVVEGATKGYVKTSDGKKHAVRIVSKSKDKDIAVVKIDGIYPLLSFGKASNLVLGAPVIALGSPAGLEFSVTEGIVSALRQVGGITYIQTDLSMNPGNSGGPLLNTKGDIVGMNTLKLRGFEGLGFAQAAEDVQDFALAAIEEDKKSLVENY